MTSNEVLGVLDDLLERSRVAILASADATGGPSVRWMSPAHLRGRPGYLYAITSPDFAKVAGLEDNARVMWMIQTAALDEILSLKGEMRAITNPYLMAQVQEAIGGKLGTFWKLNQDSSRVVVLETRLDSAEYFKPVAGIKAACTIEHGGQP